MDCLFCKIANKAIDANILYENEHLLAFADIKPQAPTHTLIIPKQHIATVNDVQAEQAQLLGQMILCAQQLAHEGGYAEDGYRLVLNCNRQGGQEVYHIHLHLLAGRAMHWPPG